MLYIFSMRLDPAKKKSDIPDKEWAVYCPCFGSKPSSSDEKRLQPFFYHRLTP
jgi:hypothetical protein